MQKIKIDSGAFWAALALLSNDCYWFHAYPLSMIVSALIGTSAPFSHCHVGNHSCVAFNSVPHSVHAPPIFALPGVDYTIPITRELWNGDELLARCSKKNGRYYLYMRDSSSYFCASWCRLHHTYHSWTMEWRWTPCKMFQKEWQILSLYERQ
jgi:hypothetical protein